MYLHAIINPFYLNIILKTFLCSTQILHIKIRNRLQFKQVKKKLLKQMKTVVRFATVTVFHWIYFLHFLGRGVGVIWPIGYNFVRH